MGQIFDSSAAKSLGKVKKESKDVGHLYPSQQKKVAEMLDNKR